MKHPTKSTASAQLTSLGQMETIPGKILFTVSEGIAKLIPTLLPVGLKMAVLMPMTSPSELISGPPELPGLIAASV